MVTDWEDLKSEIKVTKDNAVIEVLEPYFITYWQCRVSMDMDKAYQAELNTWSNKCKQPKASEPFGS